MTPLVRTPLTTSRYDDRPLEREQPPDNPANYQSQIRGVAAPKINPQAGTGITRHMAHQMDLADPLAHLRRRFARHDAALYMGGNSLGRPPAGTAAFVSQALDAWREDLMIAWRRA